MATTMTLISSTTVGGTPLSAINLTSIPQTYTDLYAFISFRRSNSYDRRILQVTANSATSGYTDWGIYNNGGTAYSNYDIGGNVNMAIWDVPASLATANAFSSVSMYVANYTSSYKKTFSFDGGSEWAADSGPIMGLTNGSLNTSSPVTTISFDTGQAGNWVQYSNISLYGIKNS